jgi:hypothetical protein
MFFRIVTFMCSPTTVSVRTGRAQGIDRCGVFGRLGRDPQRGNV